MKTNPYQKFKNPGVRGRVPSVFETLTIFDKTGESVMIFIGKLDSVAFDFGYEFYCNDGTHLRKLPGNGSGWFKSREHALGYALYAILNGFSSRFSKPVRDALKIKLVEVESPKLDLI